MSGKKCYLLPRGDDFMRINKLNNNKYEILFL